MKKVCLLIKTYSFSKRCFWRCRIFEILCCFQTQSDRYRFGTEAVRVAGGWGERLRARFLKFLRMRKFLRIPAGGFKVSSVGEGGQNSSPCAGLYNLSAPFVFKRSIRFTAI